MVKIQIRAVWIAWDMTMAAIRFAGKPAVATPRRLTAKA
jgi:hypothetical protein